MHKVHCTIMCCTKLQGIVKIMHVLWKRPVQSIDIFHTYQGFWGSLQHLFWGFPCFFGAGFPTRPKIIFISCFSVNIQINACNFLILSHYACILNLIAQITHITEWTATNSKLTLHIYYIQIQWQFGNYWAKVWFSWKMFLIIFVCKLGSNNHSYNFPGIDDW